MKHLIVNWLLVGLVMAVFVASCSSGAKNIESAPTTSESKTTEAHTTGEQTSSTDVEASLPTTSEVIITTTTTIYDGPLSPFTGLPPDLPSVVQRPAIAVKIGNNNENSRPQMGLAQADIVYEQLVESLKTRFFAVFQSQVPDEVGPVRSARTSDVGLLAGLGRPALVFSGANRGTLAALRIAANEGSFNDAGAVRLAEPYYRLGSRQAPYNLWARMAVVQDLGGGVPEAVLKYGELADDAGVEVGGVEVDYAASFGRQVSHLWDSAQQGWVRVQDGTLHTTLNADQLVEVAPTNVVVLQVVYGASAADTISPEAQTFGSGIAHVFTRGRLLGGTWSRSEQVPQWDLRDSNGEVILLQPGTTWLILAAAEGSRFRKAEISTLDRAAAATLLSTARAAR